LLVLRAGQQTALSHLHGKASIIVSDARKRRQKNRGQNNGVYYFPVAFFCPIAETMINALRSGEASETLELFAIACTYQFRER
jgi:hypothetical protein